MLLLRVFDLQLAACDGLQASRQAGTSACVQGSFVLAMALGNRLHKNCMLLFL